MLHSTPHWCLITSTFQCFVICILCSYVLPFLLNAVVIVCMDAIDSATPLHQCLLCQVVLPDTIRLSPVPGADSVRNGLYLSTVSDVTVS